MPARRRHDGCMLCRFVAWLGCAPPAAPAAAAPAVVTPRLPPRHHPAPSQNVMKTIRKSYLQIKQGEMARITGASQSVVCRWEQGSVHPDLPELVRLRNWIAANGYPWDDAWFFDGVPDHLLPPKAEAA